MNALHPMPVAQDGGPPWPDAAGTLRLVRRLSGSYGAVLLLLGALCATPLGAEARSTGLAGAVLGAALLGWAGLLATLAVVWARSRVGQPALPPAPVRRRWAHLLPRRRVRLAGDERLARMARRPQGIIVPVLGLAAIYALWRFWPDAPGPLPHAVLLGGAAVVLGFPLLVMERIVGSVSPARLPEAPALEALLFVPVAAVPLAGLLHVLAGAGMAWARPAMALVGLYVCVVAAELAVRALANWFLPPPSPTAARAAVGSFAALLLRPGRVPGGLAAPIRTHLGLDFSRSWALRYARAAALPMAAGLTLVAWGLSGVTLLDLDQRGIYERFGAPAAVWAPGAHLGLPWPFGRVRRVELGVVHSVALGGADAEDRRTGAEDAPPASADRLWDRAHPAEVSYLLASLDAAGAQSFQVVSVDLKVLFRTGLGDASALRAAYAVAAPEALVRAEAGRLLARVLAGKVLADMLGENRETLAETLRAQLQAELDRLNSGIELVGMVIEAIHPPAAAGEAYHNVQAAEIVARTAVATERGRAQASAAAARQTSADLASGARGAAAEMTGQAETALRVFTADQDAARAGGPAFLLERYFANLSAALAKSPLMIVDHRLRGADAPVIDLRSFGAPAGRPADDD